MNKLFLAIIIFCISTPIFSSEGSVYIRLSDSFFAGTEYKIGNEQTYIKSTVETRIKGFSTGSNGFVPDKVIYSLELGHKINDEFEVIFEHQCPHTIDSFEEYEYINYNEISIRRYTR